MIQILAAAMILFSALPLVPQTLYQEPQGSSQALARIGGLRGGVMAMESLCFLLHVGEKSQPLYGGLSALLRSDELAEMRLRLISVLPTDTDFGALTGRIGLSKDSAWALVNENGQIAAQGIALPGAAALRQSLDDAGIKSPVRILRDLLKQHPDHIDARVELMRVLRNAAEERTKRALQLEDIKRSSFGLLGSSNAIFDTSALNEKKLSPEQDIKIWGPYAQELETLFTSGDWRFVTLFVDFTQIPVEACSPTMIEFYGRNMGKVEQYLEETSAPLVWELYGWMYSISKRGSAKSLLERMVPQPDDLDWPSGEALSYLIHQEQTRGNWGLIANTLWEKWPAARLRALRSIDLYVSYGNAGQTLLESTVKGVWHSAKPLLESLIKTNRTVDAETLIRDLAKEPNLRDFQRMAAELALEHGREDLQKAWLALDVPEKKGAGLDDLDAKLGIRANSRLILAAANGGQFSNQIRSLINQDKIIGYRLSTAILNAEYSELLQKREGWPEKETHWALLNNLGKVLADGAGLPSEDSLHRALEASGALTFTNLLRRFVSENPSQLMTKWRLLEELKRLAEQKTREKLGSDAGNNNKAMLSIDDDRDIWGEYASLYHEVVTYLLERGRPYNLGVNQAPCQSDYFMHSQRMKGLARSMLPQIEAGLKRMPFDLFLWNLWTENTSQLELRQFTTLKDTVIFRPFTNFSNDTIPPGPVFRNITLSKYVMRADWLGIIDLQEWRWEEVQNDLNAGINSWASRLAWPMEWKPLLEAYLRLGMDSKANELTRAMFQSYESDRGEIKKTAVDLAKKCGKDMLAEQWGKL
jgi:hypothetical protein